MKQKKEKKDWELKWADQHVCPVCSKERWKTLVKGAAWKCQKCGHVVGTVTERVLQKSKRQIAYEAKQEALKKAAEVQNPEPVNA